MAIDRIDMSDMLARMRDMQAEASGAVPVPGDVPRATTFAEALERSIEGVNSMQREAQTLAAAFERGDPEVDLVHVMVASQKAGLAFTAVSEVRNKLVRAYQDVMSMAI